MTTVIAKDDDMLDWLVFKYYGAEANIEEVLEANYRFESNPLLLVAGTLVDMPDLPPKPAVTIINLWD